MSFSDQQLAPGSTSIRRTRARHPPCAFASLVAPMLKEPQASRRAVSEVELLLLARPELEELKAYVPHEPAGIRVKLDANEAPPSASPAVKDAVIRAIGERRARALSRSARASLERGDRETDRRARRRALDRLWIRRGDRAPFNGAGQTARPRAPAGDADAGADVRHVQGDRAWPRLEAGRSAARREVGPRSRDDEARGRDDETERDLHRDPGDNHDRQRDDGRTRPRLDRSGAVLARRRRRGVRRLCAGERAHVARRPREPRGPADGEQDRPLLRSASAGSEADASRSSPSSTRSGSRST